MRLRMEGLCQLCKASIPYLGRVSRRDLYLLICEHFHLSTAGEGVPDEEADKPALPKPVMAAYKKLPSFSHITSGWSVSRLTEIPFFTTEAVKHYLLIPRTKIMTRRACSATSNFVRTNYLMSTTFTIWRETCLQVEQTFVSSVRNAGHHKIHQSKPTRVSSASAGTIQCATVILPVHFRIRRVLFTCRGFAVCAG